MVLVEIQLLMEDMYITYWPGKNGKLVGKKEIVFH